MNELKKIKLGILIAGSACWLGMIAIAILTLLKG